MHTPRRSMAARPLATLIAAIGLGGALSGCDQVLEALANLKAPEGALARVDLVQSPSANKMLSWACYEWVGDSFSCGALGYSSKPSKNDMLFSFDMVFDLSNPNDSIPIPLVEILLGINVLDDNDLGVVCISFCDPDDAECEVTRDAEDACRADDAKDVSEAGDLVPTVDELVDLADSVAGGDIPNASWRVIDPKSSLEAHVQFDLGVDPLLGVFEDLFEDAAQDLLNGRNVSLNIPYTVLGSLFFDATAEDRFVVGFGPFDDTWPLN